MNTKQLQKLISSYKDRSDILSKKLSELNAITSNEESHIGKRDASAKKAKRVAKELQRLKVQYTENHKELRQRYLRKIRQENESLVLVKDGKYKLFGRDIFVKKYNTLYAITATYDNGYFKASRINRKIESGLQPLEIFVHAKECEPQSETVNLIEAIKEKANDFYLSEASKDVFVVTIETNMKALALKGLEILTDYETKLVIKDVVLQDESKDVDFALQIIDLSDIQATKLEKIIYCEEYGDGEYLFYCKVSSYDTSIESLKYKNEIYEIETSQHVLGNHYYFVARKK